jgi:hypothetical protein
LNESNLVVFTAPTAAGPWVQVLTTVNTLRNEVSFTVTSFSHFVIADGSTTLSTPAIPIIDPIAGDLAFEGLPYTGPTPTLSQGTLPVAWTLETGPGGMTVDGGTGVVSWATPTTAGSPHTVTIRASNEAGFDDESWPLSVSPPILSAEDEVKVNLSQWEYAPDIVTPFGSFPGDSMSTGKNPDDGVDGSGADLSIGTSNLGSGQAFAHWDSPPDLIGFNADATYRVSWQIAATGFASPQNVPQMRLRAGYGFTGGLGATDVVVPETGAAAPTVGGETTYQLFFDELDVAAADGTVTVSLGTPFDGQTSTENAKRLFFDWVDFEGQSTPLGGGALELECVVIQRFTKGDILAVALVEDEITEFTQGVEVDLFGGTLDTSPGSALNVTFETGSALIESTGTNTAGAILLFNTLPLQLDVAGVAALPLTPSSPSEERIYRAEVGFSAITGAPDVPPMRVILGAFDSGNLVNTISTEYIINALRGNLEGDETANPALGAMSFSAYLALPSNQPTLGGAVGDQVQASLSLIDQDSPYVSAGSVRIDTIRIESFAANLLP